MEDDVSLRFPAIGVSRLRVVNDGDGITTLAAGYGCTLRCKYCLNPQCFMKSRPWRTFTPESLLETVKIDDLYFQATGGGVVFGGGEPLLHAEFIHEFRKISPEIWKIHLESSLAVPTDKLEMILGDIDEYFIDIKDMDPEIYKAYTGMPQDMLRHNLQLLIKKVPAERICIRIPLIPDYNTRKNQEQSMELLEKMGYTRFDVFEYDVAASQQKSEKIQKI